MFASLPFPSPSSKRCCTHNTSRRNAARRCKHRRVSTMIADTLPGFRRCMLIRRSVRSPHLELCCLLGVPALHLAAVSWHFCFFSIIFCGSGHSRFELFFFLLDLAAAFACFRFCDGARSVSLRCNTLQRRVRGRGCRGDEV